MGFRVIYYGGGGVGREREREREKLLVKITRISFAGCCSGGVWGRREKSVATVRNACRLFSNCVFKLRLPRQWTNFNSFSFFFPSSFFLKLIWHTREYISSVARYEVRERSPRTTEECVCVCVCGKERQRNNCFLYDFRKEMRVIIK